MFDICNGEFLISDGEEIADELLCLQDDLIDNSTFEATQSMAYEELWWDMYL